MRRALSVIALGLLASGSLGAQGTLLFVTPAERGVIVRWVWPEEQRPTGYLVERRSAPNGPWIRLTPRPLMRTRDRATARSMIGEQFDRYSGLLFPESAGAERADPETFRSLLLWSADLEPGVARVLGLRLDDTTAGVGIAYEYRLFALGTTGEQLVATSGVVQAGSYRPAAGPDGVVAVTGPRGAALRWAAAPRFSAYHVYRGIRRDGSDARRLNDTPVIVFTRDDGMALEASATFFTDTAPPNDSAFYQVRGIDMFGRLSAPSAPARYTHRPAVVVEPPVLVQARVSGDTVVVSWQDAAGAQAARYQLWRADSSTGVFTRVGQPVRPPAREQRDPGRPSRQVSWYRVTALDDAGRESDPSVLALAEVPDRQPPPAPDSLTATPDTARLSLRWRHVAAPDLRGYRVYRASQAAGTFVLLSQTPRPEARFDDAISARADHPFYYRVTAVDSAFNESRPSAVLEVRPPDVTPPSAPRVGKVTPLDGALALAWLANPEPDVVAYRVRYRGKGEANWRDLASPPPASQRSDTISGLTPGRAYEVTVLALDDAGNASLPAPFVEATPVRRRPLERPDLRTVSFDARVRGVVVTWTTPRNVREMLVLRRDVSRSATSSDALRPVGSVAPGVTRFVDRTVKPGQRYEYVVRARDAFGNQSDSRARNVDTPAPGRGS